MRSDEAAGAVSSYSYSWLLVFFPILILLMRGAIMGVLGNKSVQAGSARGRWPGPRGNFLWGCLREFRRDQLHFLRETWRTHGDYMCIPTVPRYSIYVLADPAAVEHVLVKNYKNYRKAEFITEPMRLLLGNGLFNSEGDFWLRQRRLAQPAFLRGTVVQLAASMTAAVDRKIRRWEAA